MFKLFMGTLVGGFLAANVPQAASFFEKAWDKICLHGPQVGHQVVASIQNILQ